jgi:hypothetical protein
MQGDLEMTVPQRKLSYNNNRNALKGKKRLSLLGLESLDFTDLSIIVSFFLFSNDPVDY